MLLAIYNFWMKYSNFPNLESINLNFEYCQNRRVESALFMKKGWFLKKNTTSTFARFIFDHTLTLLRCHIKYLCEKRVNLGLKNIFFCSKGKNLVFRWQQSRFNFRVSRYDQRFDFDKSCLLCTWKLRVNG